MQVALKANNTTEGEMTRHYVLRNAKTHCHLWNYLGKKEIWIGSSLKIQRTEESDKLHYKHAITKIQSIGKFRRQRIQFPQTIIQKEKGRWGKPVD